MGRPKSPDGYSKSRYNRLSHGVEFDGILPSRGIQSCFYSNTCLMAESAEMQHMCVPGRPCPVEAWRFNRHVGSAREVFGCARAWLSDDAFETTIHELALAELQRSRLSGLTAQEGFFRAKVHPVSGARYGIRESLSSGRYATALDRKLYRLMDTLLTDPRDEGTDSANWKDRVSLL